MKFSLRLNNDLSVSEYERLAQLAEEAGFDQFWVSNDLFLRSAPVILTAVAVATHRIEIGNMHPQPVHHPPSGDRDAGGHARRGIERPIQPGAVVRSG